MADLRTALAADYLTPGEEPGGETPGYDSELFPHIELSSMERVDGRKKAWRGRWGSREVATVQAVVTDRELVVLRALATIDSIYVLRVVGYAVAPDGIPALVVPIPPRGQLDALLRKSSGFAARAARDLFRDMAAGLAEIAASNVVHRGVSPGAVAVFESHYALCDWDLARTTQGDSYFEEPSALEPSLRAYAAPEIIEFGTWSPRSDVWAATVVCWEALTGRSAGDALLGPDSCPLWLLMTQVCLRDVATRPDPALLRAKLDALDTEPPLLRTPSAPPWRPSFDKDASDDDATPRTTSVLRRVGRAIRHYAQGEVRVAPLE